MKAAPLVVLALFTSTLAGVLINPLGPAPPDYSDRVQIFYYPWFINATRDGGWGQWGLPGSNPPADITPVFYPLLGPYSSGDPAVMRDHLEWIRMAHVEVIIYSWGGKGGVEDRNLPMFIDLAREYGMRVALHLEPLGKSPRIYREAIVHLLDHFGSHPALYRQGGRPVVYFFAPFLMTLEGWGRLLSPSSNLTIRGTPYDVVALAQATNTSFIDPLEGGFFDGMYMYDASGLTNLREMLHWPYLYAFAKSRGKVFIPTAGPGYDDRPLRTGDRSAWVVDRQGFARYDSMWRMALRMGFVPDFITVTSFNEWGEGTQIEPAVPQPGSLDYGDLSPTAYLERTAAWVETYPEMLRGHPLWFDSSLVVAVGGVATLAPLAYARRRGQHAADEATETTPEGATTNAEMPRNP